MRFYFLLLLAGILQFQYTASANKSSDKNFSQALGLWEGVPTGVKDSSKWSLDTAIGVIIKKFNPRSLYSDQYDAYDDPGKGLTYNCTLSYELHEFDWRTDHLRLQPTVELPIMLTLVDQDLGGKVSDINFGLLLRWRDFPWNRYVYTTCGLGVGLSLSDKIWQADLEKHPGEYRSRIKFWITYQWTFALPSHPQHQLLFFVDHQSGGWTFDEGGVEAAGLGFRHLF